MNGQHYLINYFDTFGNCIKQSNNLFIEYGIKNANDKRLFYEYVTLARKYALEVQRTNDSDVQESYLYKIEYVDEILRIHVEICMLDNV